VAELNPAQNVPKLPIVGEPQETKQSAAEAALAKKERLRVIDEEIDRYLEEADRSLIEASVYLDLAQAEGFLPPKEQDSRV
jgi:hypothetical protein